MCGWSDASRLRPENAMGPLRETMKVYMTAKASASDVISLQHDMTDRNSLSHGATIVISCCYSSRDNQSHPMQKSVLKSELILTTCRLSSGRGRLRLYRDRFAW